MKQYRLAFALLAALALSPALALTPQEVLSRAGERSAVVSAELALQDARLALERSSQDPLALRIDLVRAEQAVALAEAELRQSRFEAYAELASAYTGALQAGRGVALAEAARDLATQSLAIARIRQERGNATQLDVDAAQQQLDEALADLAGARDGLALARSTLESLIGAWEGELQPVGAALLPTDLPALAELQQGLDAHPALLQARQGLELAQVALDLLDPAYAAQAQIDSAALQLERARSAAAEARRGLQLQLRQLHNQAQAAQARLATAMSAARTAQERQDLQLQRFEAGLIAEITLGQSRLETMQAELAADRARHELLAALLELQALSLTGIEGLHDF